MVDSGRVCPDRPNKATQKAGDTEAKPAASKTVDAGRVLWSAPGPCFLRCGIARFRS
jgi:hypothetical protein